MPFVSAFNTRCSEIKSKIINVVDVFPGSYSVRNGHPTMAVSLKFSRLTIKLLLAVPAYYVFIESESKVWRGGGFKHSGSVKNITF